MDKPRPCNCNDLTPELTSFEVTRGGLGGYDTLLLLEILYMKMHFCFEEKYFWYVLKYANYLIKIFAQSVCKYITM
jgi:hypothetical protein